MSEYRELETALTAISVNPATAGRWFSKSEILGLLDGALQGKTDVAFGQIRAAARGTGCVGKVAVHCVGERRGTRYAFGARPLDAATSVRTSPSQTAHDGKPITGARNFHTPTSPSESGEVQVWHGDNLEVLRAFPDSSFDLIYIDPPFNTGRSQSRVRIRTERDDEGDRTGFQGKRYRTTVVGVSAFADSFDDYMVFLLPRLQEAYRLLRPTGSLFVHLDYREVHYAKVALDGIFGRKSFVNEIIWAYDYGARAKNRWSSKHDNILWYAKDPDNYVYNYEEVDRIPYMAPSLVGEEKAARGKTLTDTWWHTIVSPNGKEKTGYPTQKPLGILSRIVRVHSNPGDVLLDFFAGSGSFGEAAANFGRHVALVDSNPEAIEVMKRRFLDYRAKFFSLADGNGSSSQFINAKDGHGIAELVSQKPEESVAKHRIIRPNLHCDPEIADSSTADGPRNASHKPVTSPKRQASLFPNDPHNN